MRPEEFIKALDDFREIVDSISSKGIDLNDTDNSFTVSDFDKKKSEYYRNQFRSCAERLAGTVKALASLSSYNSSNTAVVADITGLVSSIKDNTDIDILRSSVDSIAEKISLLELPASDDDSFISLKATVSVEIKDEVDADLAELRKCFAAQCYRSSVILCGRLLETALHRKYFEVANFDILEKNPGIGLGTLIAKLADKNVKFDPGLTQQIHLINQIRIFSVHKKKEAFYPNEPQTKAMILYTIDILEKIFRK